MDDLNNERLKQAEYHKFMSTNEALEDEFIDNAIICDECGKIVGEVLGDGRLSNKTPYPIDRVFEDGIKFNLITCWCGNEIEQRDRYGR